MRSNFTSSCMFEGPCPKCVNALICLCELFCVLLGCTASDKRVAKVHDSEAFAEAEARLRYVCAVVRQKTMTCCWQDLTQHGNKKQPK